MNKDITNAFAGKLHVNRRLKKYVLRTVAKLSDDLIRKVTRDTWILGSVEDAWAYVFHGDELKGKHLIIVSDSLLDQPEQDIEWTIMHEIGHVILGHRNSILVTQSRSEIRRQEREANSFAQKYLVGR